MDLYVLRHAIAVERGTPGYKNDSDRPLTPQGVKRLRRVARGLKALDLSFDAILSSPYLRAKQTAEIVADELHCEKKLEFSPLLEPGGDIRSLIRDIVNRFAGCETLLLVGHEPYLSTLISVLISGDQKVEITMKKGGVCKLSAERLRFGRCAALEWLVAPGVFDSFL
jgi:phosphohistidine phosphatase